MTDQKTTIHEGWQPTYRAVVDLSPVPLLASKDVCTDWLESLQGQEITVKDKAGKTHVVGIVTGFKVERMP